MWVCVIRHSVTFFQVCDRLRVSRLRLRLQLPPLCCVPPLSGCASAQWSTFVCWCVLVCLCTCLSSCPACFVSLQSADTDTVPAQLFSACLPPWRLQLQASTSSSLHYLTSPLPLSPSLPCYLTPIISLLFALDTPLLLHPLHTFHRSIAFC